MQPAEKKYHDHAQLVIPDSSLVVQQQAQKHRDDHHPKQLEFHNGPGIQGALSALLGNSGKPQLANDPLNMIAAAVIQCRQYGCMDHKTQQRIFSVLSE